MKFTLLLVIVVAMAILQEIETASRYRSFTPPHYNEPSSSRRKFTFTPRRSSYQQSSSSTLLRRPPKTTYTGWRPMPNVGQGLPMMSPITENHYASFQSHFIPSINLSPAYYAPAIRLPSSFLPSAFLPHSTINMTNFFGNIIHPKLTNVMKQHHTFGTTNGFTGRMMQTYGCAWNTITSSELRLFVEVVLKEYGSEEPYTLTSLPMLQINYSERCDSNGCTKENYEINIEMILTDTDGCTWYQKCSCKSSVNAKPIHCNASGEVSRDTQEVTNLKMTCDKRIGNTETETTGAEPESDSKHAISTESNFEGTSTTTPGETIIPR